MLDENDECSKLWCNVKHETGVLPKCDNVAFVSSIDENRSLRLLPPFVYRILKISSQFDMPYVSVVARHIINLTLTIGSNATILELKEKSIK